MRFIFLQRLRIIKTNSCMMHLLYYKKKSDKQAYYVVLFSDK